MADREETLAELLAQAVPQGPKGLRPGQSGGATLALALHCERSRMCGQALGPPCAATLPPPPGAACRTAGAPTSVLLASGGPLLVIHRTHSWSSGKQGIPHLHPPPLRPAAGLMLSEGYCLLDRAGRAIQGGALPPDWNTGDHVWIFAYSR